MEDNNNFDSRVLDRVIDYVWQLWDADYLHVEHVELMGNALRISGYISKKGHHLNFVNCEFCIDDFR